MKNLQCLLLIILFCGCASKSPYILESNIIDYSRYNDKGFFITESNSVSFEYSPIGSISAMVQSGNEVLGIENKVNKSFDELYHNASNSGKIKYGKRKYANIYDLLDTVYEQSVESGSDGIIGLKISPIIQYIDSKPYTIGYSAFGMAIKRK